jgi:conjugal transfer pilus assembly protein TraE
MEAKIFVQKSSNLFAENRLLKFVVGIIGIAVIINSFMVYRAVKYQRTILIPPTMTGTIEFVQGQPTESYIKDISRKVINLATTYSPPTARGQFEALLKLYAPESYPGASKSWYSLAGRVETSMVSSVFHLEKITTKGSAIEIFGNLVQYAGETQLEKAAKTYIITYRIRDGLFEIMEFKEKNMKEEKPEEETKK